MPNWCANTLTIKGSEKDIKQLESLLDESKGKHFFDLFVPNSEKANQADSWYSYNLETYGVKWNCDANDWDVRMDPKESECSITILFDSAWGPPISLYDKILGNESFFSVYAEYFEPGMCFVGSYEDGADSYYEYSKLETIEELYEEIPAELIESWGIVELFQEE